MRSVLSTAVTTTLALALFAVQASAGPLIVFGSAAKLPAGCTPDSNSELDCPTIDAGTTLDFSIIILNDANGMGAVSFGAQWDAGFENALTVNSATQGPLTDLQVSAGPPPVSISYNFLGGAGAAVGPGGITQSSASSAGQATNWELTGASPDPAVNILSADLSFRAGQISVTVDNTTGTHLELGWYNSLQDTFGTGDNTVLTEGDIVFGEVHINDAPEPTAGLALLTGIAAVALLGRRERRLN